MANPDPSSFATLLRHACDSDRDAWERLYRDFAPGVLGYLRSQRANEAEDLLAEVWVQVVRGIERFDGDEQAFRAWILRIAHNRIVDEHRTSVRRAGEVPMATVPERADEEPELPIEHVAELERLLAGLPDTQRAVLYLRYVLDLPQQEIATILGSSVAAVKMQQRRGVDAVAVRLDKGVDR